MTSTRNVMQVRPSVLERSIFEPKARSTPSGPGESEPDDLNSFADSDGGVDPMAQIHSNRPLRTPLVSRRGFLEKSLTAAGAASLVRSKDTLDAAALQGGPERMASQFQHPLDPLTPQEITETVRILRNDTRVTESCRYVSITVAEPPRGVVFGHQTG